MATSHCKGLGCAALHTKGVVAYRVMDVDIGIPGRKMSIRFGGLEEKEDQREKRD